MGNDPYFYNSIALAISYSTFFLHHVITKVTMYIAALDLTSERMQLNLLETDQIYLGGSDCELPQASVHIIL